MSADPLRAAAQALLDHHDPNANMECCAALRAALAQPVPDPVEHEHHFDVRADHVHCVDCEQSFSAQPVPDSPTGFVPGMSYGTGGNVLAQPVPDSLEYRFTTWDDTPLVITVDENDPGDIGEPRTLVDYDDGPTTYVSVRALASRLRDQP